MARGTASKGPKVAGPRLSPVRLSGLREDPSPDFRSGERYDGVRYSRASADGLELAGTDFRAISGLESLAGLVIDDYQLGLLAPLMASHLGVIVA